MNQKPSVGRIVHYVASGSADGKYPAAHRAAIVTDVHKPVPGDGETKVRLCVLNPGGMFFTDWLNEDQAGQQGSTWHWPERE